MQACRHAVFAKFYNEPKELLLKNPALAHTAIYGLLTPCYVSEKTNKPILRKLTDRQDR